MPMRLRFSRSLTHRPPACGLEQQHCPHAPDQRCPASRLHRPHHPLRSPAISLLSSAQRQRWPSPQASPRPGPVRVDKALDSLCSPSPPCLS
ncbi:hypothetical protein IQ07DRAFT_12769 [Pyrenochaeta sp. DS3sAY3a]|nr:hypothetical protein IQ07DRAFT_12769 [Pyrenochaeta sp. DS3sAY3a]